MTEPGVAPPDQSVGEETTLDLRATGDRIEALFDQLRVGADPRTFDQAEELLRLVTELYGAGLARVVELLQVEAPELLTVLVDDELLGSLMVVHGLHPNDVADAGGGRARLGAALLAGPRR